MKPIDYALDNEKEVLTFLKSRYPLYHMSNIFFRDIQYGIQTMFERKDIRLGYGESESIVRALTEKLEKEKILTPIDRQSWVLNYPEFRKPAVKPVAARPAPAAGARPSSAAVPRPAVAKAPLPPINRTPVGSAVSAVPIANASAAQAPPPPAAEPAEERAASEPRKPASSGPVKTLPPLGKRPLPPIVGRTPVGPAKKN